LGAIACLSFHPRKVVTTGEGGMCLTDQPALAQRLAELRNHGQAAPGKFARASGNHRLSEMAAALGVVQLSRLDSMVQARQQLARRYSEALTGLTTQHAAPGARPNHQTYSVLLPEHVAREAVVDSLRERGIESSRLSYALHELPQFAAAAKDAERAGRRFPIASALSQRGLALPLWPGLSEPDQRKVIDSLLAVLA
jgi:perosamine synthetase